MENNFIKLLSNYKLYNSEDINKLAHRISQGQFNIVIDQAKYPLVNIKEIFKNYKLQPSYQRNRVWDVKRKSRLIESLIVNVPIPPVFLYENSFSKYEVMDGLQRISTIIEFMNDNLKLEGLDLWPELNGFVYSQLPEVIKSSINTRYLSATIIIKETNHGEVIEDNIKQFIFERLNTGGMELSHQEVRNALYGGKFNDMLIHATNYSKFRKMTKLSNKKSSRMEDRELILRFFAYKSAFHNDVKLGTKELLDLYAKQTRLLTTNQVEDAEEYFYTIIDIIHALFGENAFSKTAKSNFERMIYDTLMLSISEIFDESGENVLFENHHDNLAESKFNFIFEHKTLFNGKYTAFNNVIKRAQYFKAFLLEELKDE